MTFKLKTDATPMMIATLGVIASFAISSASMAGPARSNASAPQQPAAALPLQTVADQSARATPRPTGTILEVATNAGGFTTLLAAIKAAGLTETLSGAGPFTVFAPTDAAFGKLPAGTVEELLMPENKAKLAAILTYHVVPGRVTSADLGTLTVTPATVQGGTLSIDASSGIKVGGASVSSPDVNASNGTIHVIDTVLMPPARAQ
jgi:uncharacterized surface protein with fasciclin (FAS1) repeats